MKASDKQFQVSLVGSLKSPEIKKNLCQGVQNPLFLFRHSKGITFEEAKTKWDTLPEEEKKEFITSSSTQKKLYDEIKLLAKKHFSLTSALADTEKSIASLKEEYFKTRVKTSNPGGRRNKGSRGKMAFLAFSKSWKDKNVTEGQSGKEVRLLVSEAWKKLSKEDKDLYFN